MATDIERIKEALGDIGASKTIFALVTPETEETKNKVFDGDLRKKLEHLVSAGGSLTDIDAVIKTVHKARAEYFDDFREAWTQKQDKMHEDFFKTWLQWSSPISPINAEDFKYQYPTAGASEAIRTIIDEYGNRAREKKIDPQIFLFNGEYEGYQAFADAAHINVTKVNRSDWHEMVDKVAAASKDKPVQIYLSQPSAIDGNVWPDYDKFMHELAKKAPKAEVILDLTYVGCVPKEFKVNTDHPNIQAITFSLSKPMGAYYDRIGGVLAKAKEGSDPTRGPYPSLFGNMWFKNLTSMKIGTQFMKDHGVFDMPRKYAPIQQKAMERVSSNSNGEFPALKPSDVYLLATTEMPKQPGDLARYLERVDADGKPQLRICLTPMMAEMIGTAKTHAVTPRNYERL